MKADTKFLSQVAGSALVGWALAVWPLSRYASEEVIAGAGAGTVLSLVYAVSGSLMFGYAIGKPQTTFLKVVFGGMAVRMAAVLGALFVLIAVFDVHALGMTVALLVFYAVFLGLEIVSIQRMAHMNQKKETD